MKRLFIFMFLSLSFFTGTAHAGNSGVWRSSFTATADTTKNLCTNKRGFLHGVIVSSATPNATVSVWASSGTVDSTMTIVDASNEGSYYFDVPAIATNTAHTGMTYSTVGTATIQILYECY